MSFFSEIADLNLVGNLTLVINNTNGELTITALLTNDNCSDPAAKKMPVLKFNGTGKEVDEIFLPKLKDPMKTASKMMVDMEAFMLQLEKVNQESAKNKKIADDAKKAKEEAEKAKTAEQKAYDTKMAESNKLADEKKYREAIAKLPDAAKYPEKAEELKNRKDELVALYSGAEPLFATVA